MRTVVIIPARGGSKGIPRKNLRPLGGKPLIAWSIEAAAAAEQVDRVVVSTDSDEIARVAGRFGAEVLKRDPQLAQDAVTLDPVIHDAVIRLEERGEACDLVLTVQPTSPLLRPATIDRIVRRLQDDPGLDTILTATDDTHLAWRLEDGVPVPDYAARVNRQSLPRRLQETGGVVATRRAHVTATSRFGPALALQELQPLEAIDIDGPDEWLMAEAALGRRRVAFVVIGHRRVGLGHVTRAMTLIESLTGHIVRVFCDPMEELAIQRLREAYFPVEVVPRAVMLPAILAFGADVVVHDELDTRAEHLRAEREAGLRIVTFEDGGAGLEHADLVFNALYPADDSAPADGRWFGPEVYCLREEFRHLERPALPEGESWHTDAWRALARKDRGGDVARILVTFGGTDPGRLTYKVLDAIARDCPVPITVVAGMGLSPFEELQQRCDEWREHGADLELLRDVPMMSEVMDRCDVAFSSAGRTLYELAHMRVPTIVLAQNQVELKHTFASPENGFLFLGLGEEVTPGAIRGALQGLLESRALRDSLCARMARLDLEGGRDRVIRAIVEL